MSEQVVNQIIAEIIAEDRMTSTLRDARRKIKGFEGSVDDLNKTLTKNEKEALRAAAAEKRLAMETKALASEAKRAAAAEKQLADAQRRAADEAKRAAMIADRELAESRQKTVETIKKGVEQLGVSGESLANVWTFATVAVVGGAIKAWDAVISLAKDAIGTYINTIPRAKEASDRLSQAYTNLKVTAVEAAFGTGQLEQSINQAAIRVGVLDESMQGLADTNVHTGYTLRDAAANGLGAVGDFFVLGNVVRDAATSFDAFFEVSSKIAMDDSLVQHMNALRVATEGVADEADRVNKELRELEAATGLADDTLTKANQTYERAKAEQKRMAQQMERLRKEAKRLSEQKIADILDIDKWRKATEEARKFKDALKGIVDEIELGAFAARSSALTSGPGGGLAGAFGGKTGNIQFSRFTRESFGPAKEPGLGAGIAAGTIKYKESQEEAAMLESQMDSLNASAQDLATQGIALVATSLGDMITGLAAGTFTIKGFALALAEQFGDLFTQVGAGMIALSTATLLIGNGGLFSNPLAGLAAGAALLAGGAALKGLAQRFGGGGGSAGKSSASPRAAASEVTDVVTSRLGGDLFRERERAGNTFQIQIGDREVKDFAVQSVREAIVNREIASLSPAGQPL